VASHPSNAVEVELHLVEHRRAGHVADAADDHPAGLSAGVQIDG